MIKKLTSPKELAQILALSTYAFNFTPNEANDNFMQKEWQRITNWGAIIEGKLASQILVFPYEINLFGKKLKIGGIANVASYPEYRGQGTISRLFSTIFDELNAQEVPLSYLAPFSQPFYRKYGYEVVFDTFASTVHRRDMAELKNEKKGKIMRVNSDDVSSQEIIKKLYQQSLATDTGSVIRADWLWERHFYFDKQLNLAICFDDDDQPIGYLFYRAEGEKFIVKEVAYLNGLAIRKIASFIASHSGSFETFHLNTTLSQQLPLLFADSRVVTQEKTPGMMVKIVSFPAFIAQYAFNEEVSTTFTMAITDQFSAWNHGTWAITIKHGVGQAQLLSKELQPTATFQGPIQIWTQVFFGHSSLKQHLLLESVVATDEAKIDEFCQALPAANLGLHDYF